jgi:hypothetical protein
MHLVGTWKFLNGLWKISILYPCSLCVKGSFRTWTKKYRRFHWILQGMRTVLQAAWIVRSWARCMARLHMFACYHSQYISAYRLIGAPDIGVFCMYWNNFNTDFSFELLIGCIFICYSFHFAVALPTSSPLLITSFARIFFRYVTDTNTSYCLPCLWWCSCRNTRTHC